MIFFNIIQQMTTNVSPTTVDVLIIAWIHTTAISVPVVMDMKL